MEKLLKKGHYGVIAQFHSIQGFKTTPLETSLEMEQVFSTYSLVFELPIGLPPTPWEHNHNIPLVPGSQPPNVYPYRYPFSQTNEIEKVI